MPAATTPATFAPIPMPAKAARRPRQHRCRRRSPARPEAEPAEALERARSGALAALEDGAVLALAQVGTQGATLRAREALLVQARERELCLLAGQATLELFAEGPAGRKMRVSTAPTETSRIWAISAYERPSSSRMTSAARWLKPRNPRARRISQALGTSLVVGGGRGSALVELDLLGPPRRVAEALAADVVGDLDQPVVRALGALAALNAR